MVHLLIETTGDGDNEESDTLAMSKITSSTAVSEVVILANQHKTSTAVIGRETEFRILQDSWMEVATHNSPKHHHHDDRPQGTKHKVILVHGESGAGKSYFVESIRDIVVVDFDGIFLSGKFDQSLSTSRRFPFQPIVDALGDLCDVLALSPKVATIAQSLEASLGAYEWEILTQFVSVPHELNRLVYNEDTTDEEEDNTVYKPPRATEKEASMNRLQLFQQACVHNRLQLFQQACVHFLKSVSSIHPLLVFLDDTQWATEQCFELMTSIILALTVGSNDTRGAVQFVVSFRDGYDMMERLSVLGTENCSIVDIPMKNFNLEETTALMCHLMSSPSSTISMDQSQLGTVVHEKTGGNPFFIVEFFELSLMMTYITWNEQHQQMECSDIEGVIRLDVSDGVVASVDKRVYHLKPISRSVLMLAAHVGFEIQRNVLTAVVEASPFAIQLMNKGLSARSVVNEALEEAESHNLLIQKGKDSNTLFFMHDRVQQCFHEMMPVSGDKDGALMSTDREEDERILFIAVDSLNAGRSHITSEKERSALVELNIRASELTASKLSFASAADYLKIAIELVPKEKAWLDHYDLSLALHQRIAQMYCNCLQIGETHHTLDTVMTHARLVSDRQRAYHIRFIAHERSGQNELALSVALAALEELNVTNIQHRSSPTRVMWKFLQARTRLSLRWRNVTDLLKLEKMKDQRILAIVEWLQCLGLNCLVRGDNHLMMFCFTEAFQLSFIHGQTGFTPAATAAFGMLEFAITRNPSRAYEMGRLAVKMLDTFEDTNKYRPMTEHLCQMTLLAWRDPLDESVIPAMERASENGVQYGDLWSAKASLVGATCARLHLGQPLRQMEKEMRQRLARIEEWGIGDPAYLVTLCHLQTVHNHMGLSDDPLILTGEVMSEEDMLKNASKEEVGMTMCALLFLQFRLACHYRSLHNAASLLEKLEKNTNSFLHFTDNYTTFQFFACLTYLDLVQANETAVGGARRKYTARAKKAYKAMLHISSSSEKCYAAHLIGILKAEFQFVVNKKRKMMDSDLYNDAIEKAMEGGFLSYAAIACERAGVALLVQQEQQKEQQSQKSCGLSEDMEKDDHDDDDDRVAIDFIRRGLEINERWEAFAKVDWYLRTYSAELDT